MPKITELYCFAVNDKDEDDEGVPAINTPIGPMPLMGADVGRVTQLMPKAQEMANQLGKPLRIYHFTNKSQVGEVIPQIGQPETALDRCWDCNALLLGVLTNHRETCSVKKMIDDINSAGPGPGTVEVSRKSLGLLSTGVATCPECRDYVLNGKERFCPSCGKGIQWKD